MQAQNSFNNDYEEIKNSKSLISEVPTANKTLTQKLADDRNVWTNKLQNIKKIIGLPIYELGNKMEDIYTERQLAVDNLAYLRTVYTNIKRDFNSKYAIKYNYYSFESQRRYSTETSKNAMISADLGDIMYKKELIEIQIKYFQETLVSIDSYIYGIKNKIDIEQHKSGKY